MNRHSPLFRFTIRDVLWLMVVVAIALVWYLERGQHRATRQQLQGVMDTLEAVGVEIEVAPDHVQAKFGGSNPFDSYTGLGRHDPQKAPVKVDAEQVRD